MYFYEKELARIKNDWEKTHPERVKIFSQQYLENGFSDEDTWNLDIHLAKLIYPRLVRFKEIACVVIDWPLNEIIEAFRLIVDENVDFFNEPENYEKIKKGLKLFAEYYFKLWW